MKKHQKIMLGVNVCVISAIFLLNYFYQQNGFDFTLKCVCSGGFALLGAANLIYALTTKQNEKRFYIGMALGLFLAFLGDVLIRYDFIVGAATFALGHVCLVIAYCFIQKIKPLDLIISGVLFVGAAAFLMLCPLLTFDDPVFRVVCIIYALIISLMLGKAAGNLINSKNTVTGIIAAASSLFFFSDLMLVFDWFIGLWNWTDHACMGTYYPALCLLAFSMILKAAANKKKTE
ncbi:MAG: lysoplasmalogenase [Clostridia bacterium]|nr:lysoplasmalogenase [Clostridia bacterium]